MPFPYTEADAAAWLTLADGLAYGQEATFAIVEISTDALLGGIGIRVPEWPVTDLGYWVASSARRRGIAVRAVRLLAAWAFDRLGSVRVEISPMSRIAPPNRSRRKPASAVRASCARSSR